MQPHRMTSIVCVERAMRWVCTVVVALNMGINGAWAQNDGNDGVKTDRARLIEGVREVAAPGAPGSLAVFDPRATAVVVGKSGEQSEVAVVASGHLGRGRIVAFAHDGYFAEANLKLADTARLIGNAVRWAAGDRKSRRVGLIEKTDLKLIVEEQGGSAIRTVLSADLSGYDVLVLIPYAIGPAETARVRAFVEAGGGLLAAATGWGWQQGSNKPMADFPGNSLVHGSGLAWTDEFANRTAPLGYRADGSISPYVNADRALALSPADRNVEPRDFATALASIRLALKTVAESEPLFRANARRQLESIERLDLVPTKRNPVGVKDHLRRYAVGLETVLAQGAAVTEVSALAAANNFPGGLPAQAARGEHTVTIDTAVPGWHSLGLYAAPGEKVSVTVASNVVPVGLELQIGCHTDELWDLDSWERIPAIVRRFPIKQTRSIAASALGGLVYVDVPESAPASKVAIAIQGVVEAPYYELDVTTAHEWKTKNRLRAGPWAELAGRTVIFSVPSSLVRDLDDPRSVLALWDRIVEAQDQAVSLPRRRRPERIVADVQISAGYMHSGYPIMIPIDDSIKVALDERRLRAEGAWGLFHELGHNHQSDEWTFEGTGEVTNNVLVLYVFDKVLGLRYDCGHPAIRDRDQRTRRIRAFMAKGAPFAEWKDDPFLALMMYMELYEGFGWKPFERVFADYRTLPRTQRPSSEEAKRDQWLVQFSRATGKNLGPFFQAWGVPTSAGARASIEKLPAWMPARVGPTP
jgi:hypothetical protein